MYVCRTQIYRYITLIFKMMALVVNHCFMSLSRIFLSWIGTSVSADGGPIHACCLWPLSSDGSFGCQCPRYCDMGHPSKVISTWNQNIHTCCEVFHVYGTTCFNAFKLGLSWSGFKLLTFRLQGKCSTTVWPRLFIVNKWITGLYWWLHVDWLIVFYAISVIF